MVAAVFEFGGVGVLGVFSVKRLRDAACNLDRFNFKFV